MLDVKDVSMRRRSTLVAYADLESTTTARKLRRSG